MMSKHSSKRERASAKATDWVEPSFSDFCKSTHSPSSLPCSTSLRHTNHHHKKKEPFSLLQSGKSRRKKGNPSSLDEVYQLINQNLSPSQTEPWVDKYRPKTQNELAVHKKKIEEVETWLKAHVFQRPPKQGGSILLLTGPPGCGKSATVEILAQDLGIQVQEWTNPILLEFKKDDFQGALNHEYDFQLRNYQTQTALFQEFLLRANKYTKLQMVGESLATDKRLILVEDMPNNFYREPSSLHELLRRYVRTGRCPLVFIISDGATNQRSLFPKEIHEELCIGDISFNPVAPTIMMKVLHRISEIEANMNGGKNEVPDKTSLELICKGCSGDIRSAINSLQFSCLKELQKFRELCSIADRSFSSLKEVIFKNSSSEHSSANKLWSQRKRNSVLSKIKKRRKSDSSLESQEVQAIGGKDASIFLFHALGKILYCKREPVRESNLPFHLSEYERDCLLVQPEDVIEKSHMPGDLFNLYLHQNYVDFFSDIADVGRASEYLSTADFLCSNWDARSTLWQYSASVATRGVMHSNSARAFAQSTGGMGFRPLYKPQWFLINKKYQENCIAAKSLFSSFCLPPLCLQTELIPYLAMLTNPMRNQVQITFIQDVGRLPLKKYSGRLKLDSFTDKDSAIQILECDDDDDDDEGDFVGRQPTNVLVEMEKNKTSKVYEDPLSSSQSSGNELSGSQPQPFAAQAIMEEDDDDDDDELNIEEYNSD